jgi:hypothetical protein
MRWEIDLAARYATGLIAPGAETIPRFAYALGLVLSLLFREEGYLELHGAALVYHGKGLLLVGRSGSGKSTLAYTLVRRGWQYLTLLYRTPHGVKAVSFRKDFGLDAMAVVCFPKLANEQPP